MAKDYQRRQKDHSETPHGIVTGLECQLKTIYGHYKNVRITKVNKPLPVTGNREPKFLSFHATHDGAKIRPERIAFADVEEVLPVDWKPEQQKKKEVYDDGLEWW